LIKLKSPSGKLSAGGSAESGVDKIVRPALLVHSGPDGSPIVFQSADGEIEFDDARIQDIVKNHNAEMEALVGQYGGEDKMPIGAWPPILDQHEDDSSYRISGRLAGMLRYEKQDVPGVGANCSCVCGDITFLGKEIVERVQDGRIYHLSIGIKEESNTLGEVSTVIEPAAAGARVLNKGAKAAALPKGEKKMAKNLKAAKAKRLARMKEIADGMSTLSAGLTATSSKVKLAAKKAAVTARLSSLMKAGKLTPAEFKKMSIAKLAAMPDEAMNTVVETFEAREPQVTPGQRGTSDAVPFTDLAKGMKKKQVKNLKSETIKDLKKLTGGKIRLKGGDDEMEDDQDESRAEMAVGEGKDEHAVPGEEADGKEIKAHLEEMGKHLENGDIEQAKMCHMKCMEALDKVGDKKLAMGEEGSEEQNSAMQEMQGKVDELSTQMARFAGMVKEMMGDEVGDDKKLGGEEEGDEAQLSEEVKDDKDLA
jgi:hypothetical protein